MRLKDRGFGCHAVAPLFEMGITAADRIAALLGDGQAWTGAMLAQGSGLSLRTVRRALAELRDTGVAIDTEVGRGGGIRLGARSALPNVRLSHREAIGLLFALAVAESLGLPLLGSGLGGLRSRLSSICRSRHWTSWSRCTPAPGARGSCCPRGTTRIDACPRPRSIV